MILRSNSTTIARMADLGTNGDFASRFGTTCEVQVLEERIKKNGEIEILAKGEFKPSGSDKFARYALVAKREFDKDGALRKVLLQVNSFPLLKVFKDVVKFYPTIATGFDHPFEMEAPFGMLYHYWAELQSLLSTNIDDMTRMHLKLLLTYMEEELGTAKQQNESMIRRGFVRFKSLWALFKPGELQFQSHYGHPRLLRLDKTFYGKSSQVGDYLDVRCSYVDYNGEDFGQAQETIRIIEKQHFGMSNAARITGLPLYPRCFVEAGDELETQLQDRGSLFFTFTGVRIMRYHGKYEFLKLPPSSWYHPDWRDFGGVWLPQEGTGRVIIDRKLFAEDYEDEQVGILPIRDEDVLSSDSKVLDRQGKLDQTLCPSFVYGFFLQHKVWCRFYIDCLEEVDWKPEPMNALILPDAQKRILTALVSSHKFPLKAREEPELKGKGMVILLHGSPGSGKTMTAETAAETTHKALLSITMGELSTDGGFQFEIKLQNLLRLATTWKAVVLIDEADVFLEHRRSGAGAQAEKNALVAVFLKHLEYFQGIIFLTSNRVDVFDAAVGSRIHLALQYNPPTVEMRLELWRQRLSSLDPKELDFDLDEVLFEVRQVEMNGREISNTFNSALTLARHANEKVRLDHIVSVVQVWQDFHSNIKRMAEMHKTMPRQDSIVSTNP